MGEVPPQDQPGHQEPHRRRGRQIIAGDRESHQRDLFNAIERGEFPSWLFCAQIMDEATAKNYKENPFDITKTWSQKEFR